MSDPLYPTPSHAAQPLCRTRPDAPAGNPLRLITPARWQALLAAVDLLTAEMPVVDTDVASTGPAASEPVASTTAALRQSIAQLEYLLMAGEAAVALGFLARPFAGDAPAVVESDLQTKRREHQ